MAGQAATATGLGRAMAGVESTAEADLQLLQSNLAKSKRISGRASALLGGFDDRLARLERSVSRIHGETSGLTRSTRNVEALLQAVDALLSSNDMVEREERVITKGVSPDNIQAYMNSVGKVDKAAHDLQHGTSTSTSSGDRDYQKAFAAKSRRDQDAALSRMHNSVESGLRQLGQLALTWVNEQAMPAALVSQASVQKISHIVHFISQHDSDYEKDFHMSYADARASVVYDHLSSMASEAVEASRSGGIGGGATLGSLLQELLVQSADEYDLIQSLGFPTNALPYIYSFYLGSQNHSPLHHLVDAGVQINNIVKKNLFANVKVAFEAYGALSGQREMFHEWIRNRSGRSENELSDICHALKSTCVRSLPEVFEDIRAWGNKGPSASEAGSAQIAETTQRVFAFMQQLVDVPEVTESMLQTLGDGNWDFAAAASMRGGGGGGASRKSDPSDVLLEKYLGDLLGALLNALESRSKALKAGPATSATAPQSSMSTARPTIGAIFLLNNVSFLRREVLSTAVGDVLGDAAEDHLNRMHRQAKSNYLEMFSGMIGCLMDAGTETGLLKSGLGAVGVGPSGEKRDVKVRFVRFNEALADVESVHRIARLDPNEEELRDRLQSEVSKMVIPTYSKFASRNVGTTHHQLDVSTVESRLNRLFD